MPTVCQSEFANALVAGRSSPPRSFREWMETEIVLPDGPFVGQRFRVDRQPAHGVWIDAVDDPQWSDLVFTAVTQFGKSLLAHVCPIIYHTCELGQSLTWALPTSDMADTKWQQDFRPVFEASPTLRKLLPRRGSGARGGKVRDMIVLANGAIIKIQSVGADDSAKGGFTSPVMAATEIAGFSRAGDSSVEADPLRQARARQRAYKRSQRRAYLEGTLTTDEELPATLYAESTRSRLVAPCPHCSEFVHPDESNLLGWREAKTEMEAARASHWVCPTCKRKITERQRESMLRKTAMVHDGQKINRDGKITGPKPETSRLWFHATPFFNLLLEAGDIGAEEWATEQIPEDTQERIAAEKERAQFRWARTYKTPTVDGQIEIDRKSVGERRNKYPQNQLPDDVDLVTIGYDTGDRRGWYAVLASLANGELIVPAYGDFEIHSDKADPKIAILAGLEEQIPYLEAGFPLAGGGTLRAHRIGCDAGHEETATWNMARNKALNPRQSLNQWFMPMRGRGESQMERRKWNCPKSKGQKIRQVDPDRAWYVEWVQRANVFEMHFNADQFKLRVQHALTLDMHAPGSISFFAGTSRSHSRIARHITNERLIWEFAPPRGRVARWHRYGDNHLLDCLGMAYALQVRLGYQPPPLPKVDPENTASGKTIDTHKKQPIEHTKQHTNDAPTANSTTKSAKRPAKTPKDEARERVRKWLASIS